MSRIYGYCRVSTQRQSLDRQNKNILERYPGAKIYSDKYTGRRFSRPMWERLMNTVTAGDTIVFDSVSRMSRNAEEGFAVYEELFRRGIVLEFIKEPMVNTEVYRHQIEDAQSKAVSLDSRSGNRAIDAFTAGLAELVNRLFMDMAAEQIRIAFDQSEKEVSDLRERICEGVQLARAGGKQIGRKTGSAPVTRKSIEAKAKIRETSRDFNGSLNDADCMKVCGIARNTFYKYKREMREEEQQ